MHVHGCTSEPTCACMCACGGYHRAVLAEERGAMLRDVLARATPAGLSDTSIGVYARLRPGGEAGTEVEVKRKAGEQRHIQVLLTPGARIAIARMLAAA